MSMCPEPFPQTDRATPRKSPLAAILGLPAIGGVWYLIAQIFLRYQQTLYPSDAFLFNGTRIGNILMFVSPCFPSLAFGLLIGNVMERLLLGWQAAADDVYRSSQIGLAKFGAALSLICLPLSFAGANNFWALSSGRINYRPLFSVATARYDWRDIVRIETGCSVGKAVTYDFVMTFRNGTSIDVMQESTWNFWRAYPEIQLSLRTSRYEFSSAGLARCSRVIPKPWLEILSQPPTGPS